MGSKYFKKKRTYKNLLKTNKVISISSQLERLKNSFPNLQIEKSSDKELVVILKLRPDIFSKEYDVKIVYEIGANSSDIDHPIPIQSEHPIPIQNDHVIPVEIDHLKFY